ncbi:acyl-CoA/acyl-ACP dehydrogenase [Virgibacillus sp. MSP4-1]|uniref:acyl-CoA dehydrogenase family protein n=1 Tax=Virgibacillus sp. MSP4-1 TaxID=2700081 RepID=UPI00039F8F2F|nr:acyl-CoA dehydrogenase family protein [Virgibacillus sp. MSP4-1]QHS23424.1 acyl-CoA/acyl-ACP dehydrogenase [Virgibacillus sp. MSP4-1]
MDFSLNEEQEMFRNYVRKYMEKSGQTQIAKDFLAGNNESLKQTQAGLAELGCSGINISEKYEGLGLNALDLVPINEEMGRVLLPGPYLETMALVVPLLEKFGSEKQKEMYLPKIASGSKQFSLAWLEPGKSYCSDEIDCNASVDDDSILINGVKTLVNDADQVDTLLLIIRTAQTSGSDSLSLVFVDISEKVEITQQQSIDDTRRLYEVKLEDVSVPRSQVLGEIDQGWSVLQEGLLYLNAAISSVLVGSMDKILEMSTEYAKIREQFGQPIGRFQAIKHRIVNMKMELETARSLSYYANWIVDSDENDRVPAVYSARAYATKAFIQSASHNIQIHGGIGFTKELDCHLFLKRARFFEHYLGSISDFHQRISSYLYSTNMMNKALKV